MGSKNRRTHRQQHFNISVKAIDFFCGAGGLTRGLLDAGIDVVLGIDNSEECRDTYEWNNFPAKFIHADLRTASVDIIGDLIEGVNSEDLLFAACAPCQPFTKLHPGKTNASDARKRRGPDGMLLGSFLRFVRAYHPGFIVIENVPGLAKVKGNSTYGRFKKRLVELGYEFTEGVVDAKWYGVPQTRRRLVMIASRFGRPSLPPSTHGPGLLPFATVKDAILDYPKIPAGGVDPTIPNHRAALLSQKNLDRIMTTPVDGGDRRQWSEELVLACHSNGHKGHTDVYGRMWWERPAPALTCRCISLSNGRFGHPEQNRAISLREAAALQSFNDSFQFFGPSMSSLARQIGNAVPVKLGLALGRHVCHLHSTHRNE